MNVIHNASDLQPGSRRVCVAIGVFDGVHLGHQQVIRQTISNAAQHEGIWFASRSDIARHWINRHPAERYP